MSCIGTLCISGVMHCGLSQHELTVNLRLPVMPFEQPCCMKLDFVEVVLNMR